MEKQQKRVKQFMELFGQDCPEKPVKLDLKTAKLRASLILEEALETITKGLGLEVSIQDDISGVSVINKSNLDDVQLSFYKVSNVNLVELADGISDVSVVSYGTAIAAGIDMEPIDKEVSSSNMSKAWKKQELDKAKEMHPDCTIEEYSDNLYRVKRQDGKVIKSPSYKPAEIEKLIKAQQ